MTNEQTSRKIIPSQQWDRIPRQNNQLIKEEANVGKCLREIRTQKGLSMRVLAEMSGLNINTLSLIENGRTSPNISSLQQLAQSLQVSVTDFFQSNQESKKVVFQKQGKRSCVQFEHSVMEDLAAGMSRFGMEPIIVTFEPNANSGKKAIVHTGREIVYCLDGHIVYTVESEKFLLGPGDSLSFEAYLPHRCENIDATSSRVLLVLCPMDERDRPRERHFS